MNGTPKRRFESTRKRVEEGAVYLLESEDEWLGSFTLTTYPVFNQDMVSYFTKLNNPMYLGRTIVNPRLSNMEKCFVTMQCFRKSFKLARGFKSETVRTETRAVNRNFTEIMLEVGFRKIYSSEIDKKMVYLERRIIDERMMT
ncbi:hypothetical protein [Pseudobacteriovorax antillogorgiicola]|nr:hypothetical protein [Pseudobacteriovorax antillogorgiicola]